MIPLFYSVIFQNQSITNANGDYDLFELKPLVNRPIFLLSLKLDVISELGDAQEEQLRIAVIRGHTTSSNGAATSARSRTRSDLSSGVVAETIGSTIATGGTTNVLDEFGFNVRAGLREIYTPEERPACDQGDSMITIRLMEAVDDDLLMSGILIFGEL